MRNIYKYIMYIYIMKIAVLVYGRLNKCVEPENIINSIGMENTIDFFLSSDNSEESQLQNFINLYNPKSYTNEQISNTDEQLYYNDNLKNYEDSYHAKTNIYNMTCHFLNKKRVFKILKNYCEKENLQYDVIISLRIDRVLNNKFDFNTIEDNTIYIPNYHDWGGINDQIAYGNINVMEKYMFIIDNCIYLCTNGCLAHPERLTLKNIMFNNIKISRVLLLNE